MEKERTNDNKLRVGFVSILGRPNVGKSTILNSIIREKVAIVSPKPQTTRNKIFGIYNDEDSQIIFVDTPGIHTGKNSLDTYMQKSINSARKDADIFMIVFDATKRFGQMEIDFIKGFEKFESAIVVVLNKVDLVNYEKIFPILSRLNELSFIKAVVPVSGLKGKNVDTLIKVLKELIPEGVAYFDRELYTDKSLKFLCSEIIREKALWLLQEEIPHGIVVVIDKFEEEQNSVYIGATMICEKKSHKQIIIGRKGEKLKEIGSKARIEIESLVEKKCYLDLFVKVQEDWRDKGNLVSDFGYDTKGLE